MQLFAIQMDIVIQHRGDVSRHVFQQQLKELAEANANGLLDYVILPG